MQNRDIVKLLYHLVSDLNNAMPYLQFDVFTPHEPSGTIIDLYLVASLVEDVIIGGYAINVDNLMRNYGESLLHLVQFFTYAWMDESPWFLPEAVETYYNSLMAGDPSWWLLI